MAPLKYLSNFRRTLEMLFANCEIYLQLIESEKCLIVAGTAANQIPEVKATDAKLYVPMITSSTQDNIRLFIQLGSGL